METVSGFKRFIVCIFSQSKPRELNLFKIYIYIYIYIYMFHFRLIIIVIKLIKIK